MLWQRASVTEVCRERLSGSSLPSRAGWAPESLGSCITYQMLESGISLDPGPGEGSCLPLLFEDSETPEPRQLEIV